MWKRLRLALVAASMCALVAVPVASAGWEGQIDFVGTDNNNDQGYVDVGPKGPSPGDFFVLDQTVNVIGLSHAQGPLQLGAEGTMSGVLSVVTPNLANANVTIKLAAGWIRVSGWLDPNSLNGTGPASTLLLAKGSGGILTGSRGYFFVFPGDDNGSVKGPTREKADFTLVLL